MNKERIIIGESERTGLPISAPLSEKDWFMDMIRPGCLRWIQREESFSLQQFYLGLGWCDVPVIVEKKGKK